MENKDGMRNIKRRTYFCLALYNLLLKNNPFLTQNRNKKNEQHGLLLGSSPSSYISGLCLEGRVLLGCGYVFYVRLLFGLLLLFVLYGL